jgi:UDP-N-acetylmuramyl pentapeptide phosphotransferase/UDP-N-acetylglucosamine-1-phosphate transferase
MEAWSIFAWACTALAVFLLSALGTGLSIAYARRRNLLDHPGQRRSHSMPTPRGGGIGIVVASLFASMIVFACSFSGFEQLNEYTLIAAILLVAAVGWIDDHRGLSARLRFAAHCLAALLLLGWSIISILVNAPMAIDGHLLGSILALGIAGFAVVWSINLHNFMDGIDGLLATQALFVFIVLAVLCAQAGRFVDAGHIGFFAVATLGFLPFNFPRARVFMGDVGSGVLGLLVIAAVGWQMDFHSIAMASGLIACSAFVTDATMTLLSRMLRGRRWYSAHREHLYQWLARSGCSHVQVVGLYMGWNLIVVLPVLCWINRKPDLPVSANPMSLLFFRSGLEEMCAVYLLAILVWVFAKRHCLKKVALRSRGAGVQ